MKGFDMKKTRFLRAISVLLSLVLILGVAVGASAATTADDGSLEIISKNVELEAELSLVFAVDPANVVADDKTYLLVWDAENPDGEYTLENATETHESFGTATYGINGVTGALLFKTDRIAVDNFQKVFYVRTCIVRGEDKIYGELTPYSIEAYALQRLSESDVTPDQAGLYYNVLRYALAADAVLNDGAQVEDKYVIFAASGMTFGEGGATIATVYEGKMPFDPATTVVTDAAGNAVDPAGELAAGLYTVAPKN